MKTFLNGIIKENPVFVLALGLCPALAVTNKFENAMLMGICVIIVLLFSNFVISIIKKLVPESVKIPVYILIIGTFVTVLEILLHAYIPKMYEILGIYLPLIVVNCIVLGRALSVASKSSVGKSILDGLGIGIGYMVALMIIALFREVLGSNMITLMDATSSFTGYRAVYQVFPSGELFPIAFFQQPAGAFFTLAFLMAFFEWLRGGRKHESR